MSAFTATALLIHFLSFCYAGSVSSSVLQNASSEAGIPAAFQPGVKWQIEIQDPVDLRGGLEPSDAKVVDVDLFQASKDLTLIPALHVSIMGGYSSSFTVCT